MPTKFNIFQKGLSIREAIELIMTTRKSINPVDLRVESSQVNYSDGKLAVDGKQYDMSDMGLSPLCSYLDVDPKLVSRLTDSTAALVIAELMGKRSGKMFIRTGVEGGVEYIRTILKSKFNVMDDRVIYGDLLKRVKKEGWDDSNVNGVWISDMGSAIRICLSVLPESSEKFGCELAYGFDVANSELVPQSMWVKGVIIAEDFAIVSPKILGSKNTTDLAEINAWLDQFTAMDVSRVDALVAAGLPMNNLDIQKELGELVSKHLINKTEESRIIGRFNDDDVVTGFDLIRAIGKYAATLDYYHKRSSVEYISNMWCRGTKRR